MELLIVAFLVSAVVTPTVWKKWSEDGRSDRAYAEQGIVSPRYQERLAKLEAAGRPKQGKPRAAGRGPLRSYLSELYADAMLDRVELHRAKRAHRGPVQYDPDKPSVAQRFDAAVLDGIKRVQESRGWDMTKAAARTAGRRLVEPVGEKPADPAPLEGQVAEARELAEQTDPDFYGQPETADPSTWRVPPGPNRTPTGDLYFGDDPQDPNAVRQCNWCRGAGVVDGAPCKECRARQEIRNHDAEVRRPESTEPTNTPTPTTGGTVMTEASNFETAVPALGELQAACQNLSDHVAGAESAADTFQAHVEEIDAAKQDVTAAIASVQEQLAAKGVSGGAMDSITAAMEQVQAGDLMSAIDLIGQAKAQITDAKVAATEASGAAGQAQQDLIGQFGDAHNTIASDLGGDASFLDSGGGAGAGAGAGGGGIWAGDEGVTVSGRAFGSGATTTTGGTSAPPSPRRVVAFCNWCADPDRPSQVNHPGGQAAHVPVSPSSAPQSPGAPSGDRSGGFNGISSTGGGPVNVTGSAMGDNVTVNNG